MDFKTKEGTAIKNKDYEHKAGTIKFLAGEVKKEIQIVIIDD